MRPLNKAGFTIIETMLFLGISALLIMGILVGTGTSLNVQRYRDSVTSLQSFLQKQYFEVANVINDSTSNSCNGDNNISRGQSNCVILGKKLTSDGKIITVKNVIGTIPNTSTDPTTDILALQEYNPSESSDSSIDYEIEWGSSIVGNLTNYSILILRSPMSGITRTFKNSDPSLDTIPKLINEDALKLKTEMCLDSNGLFTGSKLGVLINENTTGPSGIELIGDGGGC